MQSKVTKRRIESNEDNFIKRTYLEEREYTPEKSDMNVFYILYTLFVGFFFSFTYIVRDTYKRISLFAIGCSTLIIVVVILSQLRNSFRKTPNIFIRIAENTASEADCYLYPRFTNDSQNPLLNFTKIDSLLENEELVTGVSPRWMFLGTVNKAGNTGNGYRGTVILYDSKREEKIGLGRQYDYRTLNEQEVSVSSDLVEAMGISPQNGERVDVRFNTDSLVNALIGQSVALEEGVDVDVNTADLQAIPIDTFVQTQGIDLNQEVDVNQFIPSNLLPFVPQQNMTVGQLISTFEALSNMTTVGDIIDSLDLSVEMILVDSVKTYRGKFPSVLGNVILLDSTHFNAILEQLIDKNPSLSLLLNFFLAGSTTTTTTTTFSVDDFNLHEYSFLIAGMYKNRFEAYHEESKGRNRHFAQFTNAIINNLGVEMGVSITTPLASGLTLMDFVMLFLDQIFIGMTICMGGLGVILIFALLLSNVEEKTYEFGMLRALGMGKLTLFEMSLFHILFFAIPGLALGFIVSYILNIPFDYIFYWTCTLPKMDWTFSYDAILIPLIVGFSIPLVANYVPLRKALGKSLRNSLDISRSAIHETKVTFKRLEKMGLETWQTSAAILMIVMGFVVYYVLPLSFIIEEMSLFFTTLEFVFIGMLLGLCVAALILQPLFERILVELMLFFNVILPKDRRMKTLILKNLSGHRSRSRRSFLMFCVTIAFVIFLGANFNMLQKMIIGNIVLFVGGDILAQSSNFAYTLKTDDLEAFLVEQKACGNITEYTWVTFPMQKYEAIQKTKMGNFAIYPRVYGMFYGMERNFLDASFNEYYIMTEKNNYISCSPKIGSKCDLIASLYDQEGKAGVEGVAIDNLPLDMQSGSTIYYEQGHDFGDVYEEHYDVILSEATRDGLGIDSNTPILLFLLDSETDLYSSYMARPHGLIRKLPGFVYSSYAITAETSPVLFSIPQYEALLKEFTKDDDISVVYERLFIKVGKENKDAELRFFIKNGVKTIVNPDQTTVQDTISVRKSANGAVIGFTSLFYTGGVISLVFCAYMLFLSFVGNVRENRWVFGVLRATGFSVNMLIRASIYESLALVGAAFTSGVLIGIITAGTLIMQFNLFIEMPFEFKFPWDLVLTMGGLAIILAIVGAYLPARVLKKQEIAQVLRGLE